MRGLGPLPRQAVDGAVVALALALVEITCWVSRDIVGPQIAGAVWLRAALPIFWVLPLWWRRTHAVPVLYAVLAGVALQGLVTRNSPEGLEMIFVVGCAAYSAGAYARRRTAWHGIAAILIVYPVYAVCDRNVRSGRTSDMWAAAFFGAGMVACWLVGTLLRQQRERRVLADRTSQLEIEAAHAVAEERTRLARDLHDIVSHNLSVMVVQAAGARARGSSDAGTLEKIERSGRASLVEMRRLLGVLRADDEQATLVPQPGISDLDELVQHVRDSGIPVELSVTGDTAALPPAIELSVFRIVQEALTNIVEHAGPAHATVTIAAMADSVRVEVCDDGRAAPTAEQASSGHGLIGMRERAALLHGEVVAGPGPEGGFRVAATLPLAAGA